MCNKSAFGTAMSARQSPASASAAARSAMILPGSCTARGARQGSRAADRRLRRKDFRKFWVRARDSVGLPDLHFHDRRHTGNTMAAAQGANLRELLPGSTL